MCQNVDSRCPWRTALPVNAFWVYVLFWIFQISYSKKLDVTVKLYHVFGHYQLYGVQMSQSLAEALGISIFQILER